MKTELDPLVQRYRNAVHEPLTPELDQRILAVAYECAGKQRLYRRIGGVALIAISAVAIWQVHRPEPLRLPLNSGELEGATRDYLLHVEILPHSGPGLQENQP
jgi:hypothetical protein